MWVQPEPSWQTITLSWVITCNYKNNIKICVLNSIERLDTRSQSYQKPSVCLASKSWFEGRARDFLGGTIPGSFHGCLGCCFQSACIIYFSMILPVCKYLATQRQKGHHSEVCPSQSSGGWLGMATWSPGLPLCVIFPPQPNNGTGMKQAFLHAPRHGSRVSQYPNLLLWL